MGEYGEDVWTSTSGEYLGLKVIVGGREREAHCASLSQSTNKPKHTCPFLCRYIGVRNNAIGMTILVIPGACL